MDLENVTAWLADTADHNGLASPYRFGDANLDGLVGADDFNLWNENKGYASIYWDEGDFNADGVVNTADLLTLRNNLFASSYEAVATVPEPAGCSLLLAGLLFSMRRRRVRRS